MKAGPVRMAMLAAVMAFGAIGATIALIGIGVPLLAAAVATAVVAGVVQYAAGRTQAAASPAPAPADAALLAQLDAFRHHTAALRHDLRGVLSPALMMSDRLVRHQDPAVQRAGTAVVRSIDRATALLAGSRALLALEAGEQPAAELIAASEAAPVAQAEPPR